MWHYTGNTVAAALRQRLTSSPSTHLLSWPLSMPAANSASQPVSLQSIQPVSQCRQPVRSCCPSVRPSVSKVASYCGHCSPSVSQRRTRMALKRCTGSQPNVEHTALNQTLNTRLSSFLPQRWPYAPQPAARHDCQAATSQERRAA